MLSEWSGYRFDELDVASTDFDKTCRKVSVASNKAERDDPVLSSFTDQGTAGISEASRLKYSSSANMAVRDTAVKPAALGQASYRNDVFFQERRNWAAGANLCPAGHLDAVAGRVGVIMRQLNCIDFSGDQSEGLSQLEDADVVWIADYTGMVILMFRCFKH